MISALAPALAASSGRAWHMYRWIQMMSYITSVLHSLYVVDDIIYKYNRKAYDVYWVGCNA